MKPKPARPLRLWLGNVLLDIIEWFERCVSDRVFEMAYRWAELPTETQEERELADVRARDSVEQILHRVRHKCPECGGKRYVLVPDGWTRCQTCGGTGIDPGAPEPL